MLIMNNDHDHCMILTARVYKEGEGEYLTAYMLCVIAVRTVHDLRNDI
jgi:hypothetical protein